MNNRTWLSCWVVMLNWWASAVAAIGLIASLAGITIRIHLIEALR